MKVNSNGSYEFKLFEQLDHANGSDPNDVITLNFGVIAMDSDGDTDTTTIVVNVKDDAPVANDDNRTAEEGQMITGNVTSNDVPGQDVPATVTQVVFNGTTFIVPATGTVTVPGTYGTLKIAADGSYSYTAKLNNPDGIDNFTYTLRDRDGDTDPAVLCIQVTPNDECPIIVKPADEIVDETNLASGTITETGTVTANFGNDGPGTFAGNNSFTSGGSRLNNTLSSNGAPVAVAFAGGTYTGTAGGKTIFTMKINANGSYEFKLFEQLDHADGTNANDIIDLTFGVRATDADGDSANTTVTVKVKDDAPVANDDNRSTDAGQTITGNVTTNDVVGQDVAGSVTKVVYNGQTYNLTASNTVINAVNGTLTINNTGAYSYVAKATGDGVDNFTYTLKDNDGDTDPAVLCIDVICAPVPDDQPAPKDDNCTVQICGSRYVTSNVLTNDSFGNDGPGKVHSVTYNNQVYVVATSGTTTINTSFGVLMIAASGAYTYSLNNNTDHTGIDTFKITVKDADGDTGTSNLNINILNDALNGGAGNDTLDGTTYSDNMNGNGGGDWLYGRGGNDTIHGNDGNDYLDGGIGNDTLYGDIGNDELVGREGDDTLRGGEGSDKLFGDGASTDTYSGNDSLYGEGGDDFLYGRRGDDMLDGGIGNDSLFGDQGNDTLIGGAGNDHLIGGQGNDILTGGTGADTFWFMAVNEGVDRIKDFNKAEGDKLELSNVVSNFDPVTDAINDFVFATYTGGNTIISVNNAGTGAAGATQIAVLENVNVNISDLFNNGNIIT
jgi:T1SS-143 domain-containing protein